MRNANETPDVASSIEPLQADWRTWLAGGSPREILARIIQGDPLRLRARVAARLAADALLFDADRVHLRSLARCAREAPRYRGRPELGAWLDGIVGEALADLLREDRESVLRGDAPAELLRREGGAFAELAEPLGLDPVALGFACEAFNGLSREDRQAFFQLVLRGRSLDELARHGEGGATEIARRARRALDTLLGARPGGGREASRDQATRNEVG